MSNTNPNDIDPRDLEVRSECNASTASSSSRRSNKSSASVAAAQARAKAEAARTRAAYAKRQIDMQVEKARIEATLNALKEECEAEAASAEAQVFEAAADLEQCDLMSKASRSQLSKQSVQRTGEYIQAHFTTSQNRVSAQIDEGEEAAPLPQHNTEDHYGSLNTQQPDPSVFPTKALQQTSQRKNLSGAASFHTDGNAPSFHTHRHTDSASQFPHRW